MVQDLSDPPSGRTYHGFRIVPIPLSGQIHHSEFDLMKYNPEMGCFVHCLNLVPVLFRQVFVQVSAVYEWVPVVCMSRFLKVVCLPVLCVFALAANLSGFELMSLPLLLCTSVSEPGLSQDVEFWLLTCSKVYIPVQGLKDEYQGGISITP